MVFRSINPTTNEQIASYRVHLQSDIQEILANAEQAQLLWKKQSLDSRILLLKSFARVLTENEEGLARLMAMEMGKVLHEGLAEIRKCVATINYYTENGKSFLENEYLNDSPKAIISYEALGTILGIMPFNFPFWQVIRVLVPNLLIGNALIIKHAESVSACSLKIQSLIREAGFPEYVFQSLLVPPSHIEKVISSPIIRGVTLTGSVKAGTAVAEMAGRYLKKVVLELGGNDAAIIFDDADLALAAKACVSSGLRNVGQSCISSKRIIVTKKNHLAFRELLKNELEALKYGDPLDAKNDLGPLSSLSIRQRVHEQVQKSIEAGADVICGALIPEMNGAFYPPTLLDKINENCPPFFEEIFGPVLSIIVVENNEEALTCANQSKYGLGASIFSKNQNEAINIAQKTLDVGNIGINTIVASDPRLPFGGTKDSGFGKELGRQGLFEFALIKSTLIA